MSKLRELVEKEIELANLAITASGTDEKSAYVHARYRDRLKNFLEEDDKANQQFHVPDDAELINKYDELREKQGMYQAIPEFASWVIRNFKPNLIIESDEEWKKLFSEYLSSNYTQYTRIPQEFRCYLIQYFYPPVKKTNL